MAFVNVRGKQIYYEEHGVGNKPTLVYMHGGPGESCLSYNYQAKQLGKKFHVISFDQYGVFRSDALNESEDAGVMFHVDLIEKMRIELGVKSWIPLGHSFGGMLALVYAHKYPESTDAVIYDNPMWSALYTSRAMAAATLPYFRQNNMTEEIKQCESIMGDGIMPREAFEKALAIPFDDALSRFCHVIENDRYMDYLNTHLDDPGVEAECWGRFAAFRKKIFESDDFYGEYLPYLKDINKPQLLIVGEYDMTCGKYEQDYFNKNTRAGKLEMLMNSAHLSWFEKPEEYTEIISKFVLNLF